MTGEAHAAWRALLPRGTARFDELARQHAGLLQDFRASAAFAACDAVWRAHAGGVAPPAEAAATVAAFDLATPRLYLLASDAFDQVLPAHPAAAAEAAQALAALGIDAGRLAADTARFLTPDRELPAAAFASPRAHAKVMGLEASTGFQARLLREGRLACHHPVTGEPRMAVDSYVLYGRTAYLFGGQPPFYLVTGGAGQKAVALFVPGLRLVLDYRAGLSVLLRPENLATQFAVQLRRVARHPQAFAAAVARTDDEAAPRRLVVLAGQIENPAHHLWNFLPGLERVLAAGRLDRIAEVRSHGSEFFGPLDTLYPELAERHVHAARASLVDPVPFSPDHLVLQPGGYFIAQTLRERLRRAALRTARPLAIADDAFPVVWFGLRTGSREWIGQVEGIATLIGRLGERHPRAVFLLDGFSHPVGQDHASVRWQAAIAKLQALAQEIRAASGLPDRVHDVVGDRIDANLLAAARVTAYLAPIGSTQHKVGWVSDAEGVIYSGPDIVRTDPDLRPGCWESEGPARARYVIGTVAAEPEGLRATDRRHNLQNIHLDIDELDRALEAAIARYRERAGVTAAA